MSCQSQLKPMGQGIVGEDHPQSKFGGCSCPPILYPVSLGFPEGVYFFTPKETVVTNLFPRVSHNREDISTTPKKGPQKSNPTTTTAATTGTIQPAFQDLRNPERRRGRRRRLEDAGPWHCCQRD